MAVIDEHIGKNHGSNLEADVDQLRFGKSVQHMAAEPADRAFFHRDQDFVFARQVKNEIPVERLHEAGIGDSRREAKGSELFCCLQGFGQSRAERDDSNRSAFAKDAALADRQQRTLGWYFDARALASRSKEPA